MRSMTKSYMILEEKLSTHFDNSASAETNFILPARKKSHQQKDKFDRSPRDRYDKFTPLTFSRDKIYLECSNIKFYKGGIWQPYLIR